MLIPFIISLAIIPLLLSRSHQITLPLMKPVVEPIRSLDWSFIDRSTRYVGEDRMPRSDYLLTQINVIRSYMRIIIMPINQNLDYDYPVSRRLNEPKTLVSIFMILGILTFAFVFRRRGPLVSFGIFWFFLSLSIESLVPQTDFLFEHRLYLPLVGFSIFLAAAEDYLFQKRPPRIRIILTASLLTCLAFLTYQRNFVWRDELSLWDDAVRKSPYKARTYINRGNAYKIRQEMDRAQADYDKAIALKPDFAVAYNNRGILKALGQDYDGAIVDFKQAIRCYWAYDNAYLNMGLAYKGKGQLNRALSAFTKALRLNAVNADAHHGRGDVYWMKGLLDKALNEYSRAIKINPFKDQYYRSRGALNKIRNDLSAAASDFNQAIHLNPRHALAYNDRGGIYLILGDIQKAHTDFEQAIRLDPGCAEAYHNRSITYYLLGEYEKSKSDMLQGKALFLSPDPQFEKSLEEAIQKTVKSTE